VVIEAHPHAADPVEQPDRYERDDSEVSNRGVPRPLRPGEFCDGDNDERTAEEQQPDRCQAVVHAAANCGLCWLGLGGHGSLFRAAHHQGNGRTLSSCSTGQGYGKALSAWRLTWEFGRGRKWIGGGPRDAMVTGQRICARAVAEPSQPDNGLPEARQRPAATRGATPVSLREQQPGNEPHQFPGDVKPGTIGDHVEPPAEDDLVLRPLLLGLHADLRAVRSVRMSARLIMPGH